MKKIYVSIPFLIFMSFIFLSNREGRGNVGGEAVTGAPGENGKTCGTTGCHSAGSFSPELTFSLLDESGNEVDQYVPGANYTVSFNIGSDGNATGYGFQIVALDQDDNNSGKWDTDNLPEKTGQISLLNREYVEHRDRLNDSQVSINWTAPEEGENVTFYLASNAVNGNGSPAGDGSVNGSFTFDRLTSSLQDLSSNELSIFPNPAQDVINVANFTGKTYSIYNQNGALIKSGSTNAQISVSDLNPGLYFLSVDNKTQRFIKL